MNIKFWQITVGVLVLLMGLLFAWWVSAEEIGNFNVNLKINEDASLLVTENITYDFDDLMRHGIFRDIPIKYKTDAGNRKIDINVKEVLRDGYSEPYELLKEGNNLQIKIGDAAVAITGQHDYQIVYVVTGAMNYFDDFDELYWNVTGNEWPVTINSVVAEFEFPILLNQEDIQANCYQGQFGSDFSCPINISRQSVTAGSNTALAPGSGLTLAVGFPKGIVIEPSQIDRFIGWLRANGIVFLPLIVLVVMFWLWYKKGRDPQGKGTIIAQYEPPAKLKPTLIGSLVDEKVDNRDITAGLIYLAQQGFIKIARIAKSGLLGSVDYELELLKDSNSITSKVEKDIAEIVFGSAASRGTSKKLSQLKKDKTMARKMKNLKHDISEAMVSNGFFVGNPAKIKGAYTSIGAFLVFGSFFIGISGIWLFALAASGIIIAGFGFLMGKKTKLGAVTKEEILGFKEFLSVTDKDRFKFHNAPEKNPQQFMEFLPFAIAMGVEKQWAGQFKDMYIEQPGWYEGNYTGVFVMSHFINDVSAFSDKMNSGFSQAARGGAGSTGGGFSGGGFGGGGGGSW